MKATHRFAIGQTDAGKWLAISPTAPYFCFEGESAEQVEAQASRALNFYFGISGKLRNTEAKSLSTFSKKRTVEQKIEA